VPDAGAPFATVQDLQECVALAVGSPTRFGNMSAAMKHFWTALRPVAERRSGRQTGLRIHLHGESARRPGNHL